MTNGGKDGQDENNMSTHTMYILTRYPISKIIIRNFDIEDIHDVHYAIISGFFI